MIIILHNNMIILTTTKITMYAISQISAIMSNSISYVTSTSDGFAKPAKLELLNPIHNPQPFHDLWRSW